MDLTLTPGLFFATAIICAIVLKVGSDIKRDLARIECQLTGHGYAEFKKRYDDEARCPRCKEVILTKAPESAGPGMQLDEDTLHQRVCRLEKALGVDD